MINYFNRFRRYLSDTATGGSSNVETEEEEDEILPKSVKGDAELGSKNTSKVSPSYIIPSTTTPKLKRTDTERPYKEKASAKISTISNSAAMESSEESSKEESSTARLSRRSSVLGDLFALFRRSSSFGIGGRLPAQGYRDNDYDSEDSEDEERNQEMSKEKLLQKIRQNKEIIGKVRMQPWAMKRKKRTLKVARRQVRHQEARVSKWHLYKVEFQRRSNQFWRWLKNASIYLIPWEAKIKRIESHFGSVVSSYFIFLRWVLGVNITMSAIIMFFIVIPEWLADSQANKVRFNRTQHHKLIPAKDLPHVSELNTVLDFGGYLQYSYMFYGYYSSETYFGNIIKYHVPIAYFCVNLFLLAFCLFLILKKMTSNTRKSKLSGGKQEQYVFTWKAVTGWDYNIGNSETSSSLFKANVIKMREATAEYNKKIKQKWTWLRFFTRLMVNFVILCMFAMSVVAIYQVAQITEKDTFIKQNAVSITVALITLLFPPVFELILKLEGYRPRTALRTHLFRVLFFYLINYFTLVYSLFIMLKTLEMEMLHNEENSLKMQLESNTFHIVHNPYTPYNTNKTYYEVVPSRSSRHLRRGRIKRPSMNRTIGILEAEAPASFIYYSDAPTTTPPSPTSPWTTVYPNYGPFGVALYNPKAIVGPASEKKRKKGKLIFNTVYESRPIGPIAEWAPDGPKTTQGPVTLNYTTTPRIRHRYASFRASKYDDLCWETLIGQEIAKIVTTDLVLSIVAIFVIDFLRGLWVRYCSEWWCWNLETTFPEYGEFKVAENVLHLVNNQGMIWLGTILVPMLPMINSVYLIVLMYMRAWACMTCNVPAKQIFRASRSSNFYLWLLLMMLCMSTLPVGFVIASKKPSKNCGPFQGQERFYSVITEVLHNNLNKSIVDVIQYIMSPGIVIPCLLLLLLIIYFLVLLVSGLRAANSDLSKQLTRERTEEKKKIFELAGGGRKRHSNFNFNHHRPSDYKLNGRGGSTRSRSVKDSGSEGRHGEAAGEQPSRGETTSTSGGNRSSVRSWHGIETDHGKGAPDGASFSPNTPHRYQKRNNRRHGAGDSRYPYHHSSDDQLHSPPSKSTISPGPSRHLTFLPSLQSVNEDEVDEEEAATTQQTILLKENLEEDPMQGSQMDKSKSTGSSSSTEVVVDDAPIPFTWRQRFMVCVGLANPEKLDRERAQEMLKRAVKAQKTKQAEKGQEEDIETGTARRSRSGSAAIKGKARSMQLPQLVEPDSANEEDEEDSTALSPLLQQQHPKGTARPSPLMLMEEAEYSINTDEEADDEGEDAFPPLAQLHQPEGHSARSSSRSPYHSDNETMVHRPETMRHSNSPASPIAIQPPRGYAKYLEPPSSGARRSISLNEKKLLKTPMTLEPDVASESSPVPARARQMNEFKQAQLAPEKRYPIKEPIQQKQKGMRMPPEPPRHRGQEEERYMQKEFTGGRNRPQGLLQQRYLEEEEIMGQAGSSGWDRAEGLSARMQWSDATRPPSEDSNSFRDPTPSETQEPNMYFGLEETPSPYYISNPADTPGGVISESFHYADPRLSYANPYSSYAAAMCSPLSSSDFDGASLQQPVRLLPSTTARQTPSSSGSPQRRLGQHFPPFSTTFPAERFFPPDDTKINDQSISPIPYHHQKRASRPWEEEGSTSGRGTMPPGYTTSPSGSSPEFGRPKFRISASPTRKPSERESSGDPSVRRFNIRQKSGLTGSPGGISRAPGSATQPTPVQQGPSSPPEACSQQTTV